MESGASLMLASVVLDLVFQYEAKRLAGKNFSKMTYFVSCWRSNLNSVELLMWQVLILVLRYNVDTCVQCKLLMCCINR